MLHRNDPGPVFFQRGGPQSRNDQFCPGMNLRPGGQIGTDKDDSRIYRSRLQSHPHFFTGMQPHTGITYGIGQCNLFSHTVAPHFNFLSQNVAARLSSDHGPRTT